ncbi:MAG: division/cell wall cluster transcriptional repressor MraZ [Actinomycetota bacterium]|nr:division/cell wall cluster transcriptional repressor MraZ [Actinomycetota bacterium]
MLLGEFRHSLDPKGRVFLPARWREELKDGVVVTRGLDGCLLLMTRQRFDKKAGELESLTEEHKANRDYSRVFFSAASEEQVDKQGRMNIPSGLREAAGLGKEVVLVGVNSRAEIWDKTRWEAYHGDTAGQFEDLAERIEL